MAAREGITRTGREANMCKLSASNTALTSAVKKQTPLVNRVYDVRMKLMHRLLNIACTTMGRYETCQILILGAGQDPCYDVYSSSTRTLYLVDFPEVINERKQSISDPFIKTVGVDMTNTSQLMLLLRAEGFDVQTPTIIVFECVLCYVNTDKCSELLSLLSSMMSESLVISYDPVLKSTDYRVHGLSDHLRAKFSTRGAPLLSSSVSVTHRIDHFLQAHWKYVSCLNLNHASVLWLPEEHRRVVLSEPFDEYTSLTSIHNHYFLTIACLNVDIYRTIMSSLRSVTGDANMTESNRSLRLNARLTAAESQMSSIENILKSMVMGTSSPTDAHSFYIREANNEDGDAVTKLYKQVRIVYADLLFYLFIHLGL